MRSWWRGRKGLGDPLLHSISERDQGAVGARAGQHSCRYLPVEGLVGLADLHSLLVASGGDEVKDGLLVTACGDR